MSLSVLEVLQNAQMNIERVNIMPMLMDIGMSQLSNAIEQLKTDSDANKTYIEVTEDGE